MSAASLAGAVPVERYGHAVLAHGRCSRLLPVLVMVAFVLLAGVGVVGYLYVTSAPAPDGVVVLDREPVGVPGYERALGAGQGCVFGPAWSDDVTVRLGHNGCDTRNDILSAQLTGVTYRPGTGNCVVLTGRLNDSYTGQVVQFTKDDAAAVQIDHVYPLSVAWDRGASQWFADVDVTSPTTRTI